MKSSPWPSDTPEELGNSDAIKELDAARRRAEAHAARILAERECPETVREWARAHGIKNFAEFTWMAGFAAGMRVAALSEGGDDAERQG
ncbi:MAG: hypothetical protein ING29_06300 [Azospirillum sp.]|nr:hypothetical protein [Azospirillum sp.]